MAAHSPRSPRSRATRHARTPGAARLLRRWLPLAALLLVAAASACGGPFPQSSLDPASDFATKIDRLFDSILWWAVLVFVVVEGLLVYVIFRFRRREGDEERPEPVHGNVLLEVGWTLAPAIILVVIAVPTVQTIWDVDHPPDDPDLEVQVTGHQWWWEFDYPGLGVSTANELHLPVGETVRLNLTSADVIHSFWVPRLGGKRDMVKNDTTMLWLTPDTTGVFRGQCAEFCGESHALMGMRVIVQDSADFRDWVEDIRRPAREPETELARAGKERFTSSVCISCHTVRGTPAEATIGPELTHVGSRRTIAGGILENDRENMIRWLMHPQRVKPGNLMRMPRLDEQAARELAAYLASLK